MKKEMIDNLNKLSQFATVESTNLTFICEGKEFTILSVHTEDDKGTKGRYYLTNIETLKGVKVRVEKIATELQLPYFSKVDKEKITFDESISFIDSDVDKAALFTLSKLSESTKKKGSKFTISFFSPYTEKSYIFDEFDTFKSDHENYFANEIEIKKVSSEIAAKTTNLTTLMLSSKIEEATKVANEINLLNEKLKELKETKE